MDTHKYTKNLYELLGVPPTASQEEIKTAYRNKLKEWHPDINPQRQEMAEEMTKLLNQAYGILRDPKKRKDYDKMLKFTRGKNYENINDDTFWSKLSKVSPTFAKTVENVRELYGLFKDAFKGSYKLHPLTFGIIAGGLLYFITPIDFIPDAIPIIGYIDDMAILTTIINSLQNEILAYKNWKATEGSK